MNPKTAVSQMIVPPPDSWFESITIYVAFGLVFFAVYYIVRTFFQEEQTLSASQLLGEDGRERKKSSDIVIKYSRPFFSRYVVPIVQGMKLDEQRKDAKRRLIASGLIDELRPDEFLSMKIFLVLGFPVVIYGFALLGDQQFPFWAYLVSMPLGYRYPDMMVKGRMTLRQKEAKRAMPFIVDLLALSTEAGLDFLGAIGKVVQKAQPSALVDELGQVLKEIRIGASRAEALREMAARLDMAEISSFVAILISADEMGSSIGKVLRQQSEQIRLERTLAAEREGAKAATKILGPMFLLILPAIFITLGAPFILNLMKQGGGGF